MFVQLKNVWLGNRARAVIYLSEPSDTELLIKGGVAEPVHDDPLAHFGQVDGPVTLNASVASTWHRPEYRKPSGIPMNESVNGTRISPKANCRLFA